LFQESDTASSDPLWDADIPEGAKVAEWRARIAARRMRPVTGLIALVLSMAILADCGSPDSERVTSPSAVAGFPVIVDNCGVTVTVNRPPTRVVGYYQQSVELLLALGLQGSVVGTVYPDNPPLPRYATAYKAIPQISNRDASLEQILQVSPDFVYGGYRSTFDDTAGRSRKTFTDMGITTYINPEYCAVKPITMDDVYTEIRTVARFFAVTARAEKLVADMQASVTQTNTRIADAIPTRVFVYDSGEQTATTAGGKGIGNQIIKLAGGVNLFSDIDATFTDVSWEQVLQRSPDVIVIYDYYGTPSVEDKKSYLRSRPELAGVPAIRDNRFAVLTLQDAVLGVRAPFAVTTLAKQLHPERF